MEVKLIYFGEGVTIPHTSIGMGVGAISVWIDNSGYTSVTNNVGALGYLFLETQTVEIGQPDPDTAAAFANLHGQVVRFDIAPNLFVMNGGIARIALMVAAQSDGGLVERKIEFVADNCTGVSVVSNPVSFSTEMLQIEHSIADVTDAISEDDMIAISEAAPANEEGGVFA